MKSGYEYGYFLAGYGQARWSRVRLIDRIRMRIKKRPYPVTSRYGL